MVRSRRTLLLVTPLLLAACAPEPADDAAVAPAGAVDLAAEEQAIRARVMAWESAANQSGEAFASFYVEDGIVMPPNEEPVQGRQGITDIMGPALASFDTITFEPLQITIAASGDLAVERGRYALRGTAADSTTFEDAGAYLVAWRKVNGEWMVINDMFHSSQPAAGAEGN
jgi:uncharacterized protein (TIGR02246 family)